MTKEYDPSEIFERRAHLDPNNDEAVEETHCDEYDSRLVFALATPKGEAFSVDLRTILVCLEQAEQRGHLPPIPASWWNATRNHLNM